MNTKNIIDKIWDKHVVHQHDGHPAVFSIDFSLLHEVTSAQAFETIENRNLEIFDPKQFLATIDHSIPTRDDRHIIYDSSAKKQVETLRNNTKKFGINFYDFNSGHQGIVHVIGPELGITQPGMTIVCGDSHTSTHGAFGALAFGIGTSTLAHVMATGSILLNKPKVMKVEFKGSFKPGVYAKDAIMKLIAEIGIAGGTGYIIEYRGEAINNMSMEERMTVCNMSIECGAVAGLISPDETTYEYIKGKTFAPEGEAWDKAIAEWNQFCSDDNATYDAEVVIDVNALQPMVTWGTNPDQAIQINEAIPVVEELPDNKQEMAKKALDYIQLNENTPIKNVPIDWAFIGSCTNGRIEDLRVAAKILAGKKVNKDVTMYIVPGSESVLEQAKQEGLDKIFNESGVNFRMPGCSLCLGMNDDKVPEGKRCISATNRNFVGRQGSGSYTHLASPATVAASAIAGEIVSAEQMIEA